MKNRKVDTWEMCKHPFKPFIPSGCTTLIIGTFPTHEKNYSQTFRFYYGGEKNRFWEVFERIFSPGFLFYKGPEAVEERMSFLKKLGIGMIDMLEVCWRKSQSSSDHDLSPILLTDLFRILHENESINKLVMTSRTKVFGALGYLETYFIQKGRELGCIYEYKNRIKRTTFEFQGREVLVLITYSTSPSNKHATFEELCEMYRLCLTGSIA